MHYGSVIHVYDMPDAYLSTRLERAEKLVAALLVLLYAQRYGSADDRPALLSVDQADRQEEGRP